MENEFDVSDFALAPDDHPWWRFIGTPEEFKEIWEIPLPFEEEPCGCHHCNEELQEGHYLCSVPSSEALEAERNGFIHRSFNEGKWQWYVS